MSASSNLRGRVGASRIDEAIRLYSPTPKRAVKHVYAAVSGGHDSISAALIASWHPLFRGVLHIDTGTGIGENRDFVEALCAENEWPLTIVEADRDCGQRYRDLVLAHGFPGPPHHWKMFQRLKERPLEYFFRHCVPMPERAALVSGIRLTESDRRADRRRLQNRPIDWQKRAPRRVWVKPIHEWSKFDVNDFIEARPELRRNPVVDKLHRSGECNCGAFARPGELSEIEFWYPEKAGEIRNLEAEARAAGHEWGWEGRPPRTEIAADADSHGYATTGMCDNCGHRQLAFGLATNGERS